MSYFQHSGDAVHSIPGISFLVMVMLKCLIIAVVLYIGFAQELCSTSGALVAEKGDYHSYPVSIYSTNTECGATENCYAVQDADAHLPLKCATAGKNLLCPLKEEFVDNSLKAQEAWIHNSVLCNLHKALPSKDVKASTNSEVNIIVLGGSVTAGVSTQGCCTRPECTKAEYYEINNYCNWSAYLGRWFSTLGSNIKTYNLAHAGYNSDTYKDKIVEKLSTIRKNFTFKKSDLVLLDISVNDANTFEGSPAKMLTLERGLEALIRRIYWLSEPNSMPTIVLLEFWPGEQSALANQTLYTKAYRKIAHHYNITVWSYRDSTAQMYLANKQDNMMMHLAGRHNYKESSGHAPWHVHMFYADYISATISKQLAECASPKAKAVSYVSYPVITSPQSMPAPLLPHKMHHCDSSVPPLLSITAPQAFARQDKQILDADTPVYHSQPADSWQLKEDKKGRPGFIHEFKGGPGAQSRIIFHLNVTHAQFTSMPQPQMMQILYLRTYQNAGSVDVLLCGNFLKDGRYVPVSLDALWADYFSFKISLPEIYSMDLTKENCSPERRMDKGSKYVTLELVHNHNPHGASEEQTARGDQKFKLVEMKVCTLARNNNNR